MTAVISPPPFLYFPNPNNTGAPAAGFLLFTYVAGTNTKQATWTDSTQAVQNPNPLPLDANGVAAGASANAVWLDPTLLYKFVWAPANDTDPPSSPIRSIDNIAGPLTIATLTQALIGSILYPRTSAEIANSIVPVNYAYAPADQAHGDVRRFGSAGGVDITTALQKAITAISGYGIINVPFGTNFITSTLVVGARKVRINLNRGTLKVNSNITGHVFSCTDPAGQLILEDGLLDGNRANFTVNGNGVFCDTSLLPEFYHFEVSNFSGTSGSDYPGAGVYTKKTCTGRAIVQDSFFNNNKGGIYLLGDANSISVWRNPQMNNNTDSTNGLGAVVGTRAGVEWSGGEANSNAAGGVSHYCSTATPGSYGRFNGLKATGNTGFGFYVGQGVTYDSVLGLTLVDNQAGIDLDPILNDGVTPVNCYATVVGNVISGGATSGFMSIRAQGMIGAMIAANIMKDPNNNGAIYALGSSSSIFADSNLLSGTNAFLQSAVSAVVYRGQNFITGLSGSSAPFLIASGSDIREVASVFADQSSSAQPGIETDIRLVDTSAGNRTPKLPTSTGDPSQLITIIKTDAAATMTVTCAGTDVIFNSGGGSSATEAFTVKWSGATYQAVTGGWIRRLFA